MNLLKYHISLIIRCCRQVVTVLEMNINHTIGTSRQINCQLQIVAVLRHTNGYSVALYLVYAAQHMYVLTIAIDKH